MIIIENGPRCRAYASYLGSTGVADYMVLSKTKSHYKKQKTSHCFTRSEDQEVTSQIWAAHLPALRLLPPSPCQRPRADVYRYDMQCSNLTQCQKGCRHPRR